MNKKLSMKQWYDWFVFVAVNSDEPVLQTAEKMSYTKALLLTDTDNSIENRVAFERAKAKIVTDIKGLTDQ